MIFVVAEHKDNKLKSITSELLVFAQRVSRDFGQVVRIEREGSATRLYGYTVPSPCKP